MTNGTERACWATMSLTDKLPLTSTTPTSASPRTSSYETTCALRGGAQVVSYELVLGLALVGVVLISGSLSVSDIVAQQARAVPFIILQPLGFVLYFPAAIAETNRAPFDLPEAEQELVAGYSTEYSGMRWGLFQTAEYIRSEERRVGEE